MADSATAFAPASIGNVGVGFDMLGLAIEGAGDRVIARRRASAGVAVAEVLGLDGEAHPYLPTKTDENTASIAAATFWEAHGDRGGLDISVHKGVPLQSGMGSSAASAVAAVVAANALLDEPLAADALLEHALIGERVASGGLHADNVAPSLLGGLILCPTALLPTTIALPVPDGISSVLLHPELMVNTAEARRRLEKRVRLDRWLEQQGYLAAFVVACATNDVELIRKTLKDVIIEPQRAASVPCFAAVKEAALGGGALGCSLSGSGPSIFALTRTRDAHNLAAVMAQTCRGMGIDCQTWVSPLDAPGARVED